MDGRWTNTKNPFCRQEIAHYQSRLNYVEIERGTKVISHEKTSTGKEENSEKTINLREREKERDAYFTEDQDKWRLTCFIGAIFID